MFEHILDCPQCGKRFHYEYDGGEYPETIFCPECGDESPSGDYAVLVLCRECHVKLKVPLSIFHESGNACPKCGAEIQADRLSTVDDEAETLADAVVSREKKRMLQDGDFFDKFKIISLLGKGGMAEVYLAEHLLLKQYCALKLMQKTLDQDENPVFIKRFIREAKLTHSLNHPNIVRVFDAGSDFKTGFLFLAMEYVEGITLHDLIYERDLSESDLLEILSSMADALKVLEDARIVHRDIKPSNIMYTNEGIYKLMDLGIAKMESNHQAGDMTLTIEQSTIGTPGYASPEQCRSAHQTDIRSDIYSLGATIYHAATGNIPFTGDTPVAVILNMMQNEAEPIANFRDDLSEGFIDLIEKMMKKKPSERFQNIEELQEAIEKVKEGKSERSRSRKESKPSTVLAALTTIAIDMPVSFLASKLKPLCKILLAIFLILVAGVHIYYVIYARNDYKVVPYGEFIKSIFFIPESEEKSQEADGIKTRLSRLHPLVQDPDKELMPQRGLRGDVRYSVVRAPGGNYREFIFDQRPGAAFWTRGATFANGVMDLHGTTPVSLRSQFDRNNSIPQYAIAVNFQIPSNREAALFSFCGIDLFVLNETLRMVCGNRYYVDTEIIIPAKHWVNLRISLNSAEKRINILSGDLLLGSYLSPERFTRLSNFEFRSETLRKNMKGKIDFLAFSDSAPPVTLVRPLSRKTFATGQQRLHDTLTGTLTVPAKQTAQTPAKPAPAENAQKAAEGPAPAENAQKAAEGPAPAEKAQKAAEESPAAFLFAQNRKAAPSQSVSGTASAGITRQLFPVWRRVVSEDRPRNNVNADQHLKWLRQKYKRYADNVRKLQASLEDMPGDIPEGIKKRRRAIASTAAELCRMWEKRLDYLEKRNNNIRRVKNKFYGNTINNRLQNEIRNFTAKRQRWAGYTRSDVEFTQKITKWFSSPNANPNLQITDGKYPEYSGSIMNIVLSRRLPKSDELVKVLTERYAELPAKRHNTQYLSSTHSTARLISYGLHGEWLSYAFNRHFQNRFDYPDDVINELAVLFNDGAEPSSSQLVHAVQHWNYDLVLFLLACGVDPNGQYFIGKTALCYAWQNPHGEPFRELLLAGGANPELRTRSGKTAQDFASEAQFAVKWEKRDLQAIRKALTSKQIPVDLILYDGHTLLTSACQKRDEVLVRMLLELGADPKVRNRQFQTPLGTLFSSAEISSQETEKADKIALMLLEKGASLSDYVRVRSAQSTYGYYSIPVFRHIIERYPNRNQLIPKLVKYFHTVREYNWYFVPQTIQRRMRNMDPLTPENIQLLLKHIPAKYMRMEANRIFQIPLTPEILQKIFDAGVKPNSKIRGYVRMKRGTRYIPAPVLQLLIQYNQGPEVIEAALKAGADPNVRSPEGLSLDSLTDDPRIKQLLRKYRR